MKRIVAGRRTGTRRPEVIRTPSSVIRRPQGRGKSFGFQLGVTHARTEVQDRAAAARPLAVGVQRGTPCETPDAVAPRAAADLRRAAQLDPIVAGPAPDVVAPAVRVEPVAAAAPLDPVVPAVAVARCSAVVAEQHVVAVAARRVLDARQRVAVRSAVAREVDPHGLVPLRVRDRVGARAAVDGVRDGRGPSPPDRIPSLPAPPCSTSRPGPPSSRSSSGPPISTSSPSPPSMRPLLALDAVVARAAVAHAEPAAAVDDARRRRRPRARPARSPAGTRPRCRRPACRQPVGGARSVGEPEARPGRRARS